MLWQGRSAKQVGCLAGLKVTGSEMNKEWAKQPIQSTTNTYTHQNDHENDYAK